MEFDHAGRWVNSGRRPGSTWRAYARRWVNSGRRPASTWRAYARRWATFRTEMNRRFDEASTEMNRRFDTINHDMADLRERVTRVEETVKTRKTPNQSAA